MSIVNEETGTIQTTFRSRQKSIDRKLANIEGRLKNLTSNRKTSVNQVLNFAVILADEYLQDRKDRLQDLDEEIEELQKEKQDLRNEIKGATEF